LNYHVYLSDDRHYYSVPHRYHKRRVRIAVSHSTVEIYHNHERIATHPRRTTPGGDSTKRARIPEQNYRACMGILQLGNRNGAGRPGFGLAESQTLWLLGTGS